LAQYPANVTIQPGGNPDLYTVLATVSVSVSNSGNVYGAAVPQLYVSLPSSTVLLVLTLEISLPSDSTPEGTPVKVLRGFEKVFLQPGASQQVQFQLTRRDLSYWDVDAQQWALPATGTPTAQVGWSSRDLPLNATISWMISS
jgi:beta-glucosidase